MAASTEQKVDFLLKKIGYTASKTGSVSGTGAVSGTSKQPFGEAIPSPLVVPSTSIWADSSLIPATPPGSNAFPVKVYTTASSYRLTHDATASGSSLYRSFVARSTHGNQTASIDGNWIDSQFGADYAVRVFVGDSTDASDEVPQAGASSDAWFFDYSSGVLNFNDTNLPAGIGTNNVYVVGYRYTGGIGAKPVTGIGTFSSLNVTGIATFLDDVHLVGAAGSILFDKSQSRLEFDDGVSAVFGSDADGSIKHTGNNLQIEENTGNIQFINYANDKDITLQTDDGSGGTTNYLKADGSTGQVILSYYGTERLVTTGYGVTVTGLEVTGISTLTGDVRASANLSVAGLSTFTQLVDINGGGQADTFKVEDLTPYRVVLAGAGGELQDDSKLTFDANSNLNVTGGLVVSGVSTLGSIGISTGLISGPAITYIDPAAVGDNTGLLVIKGNLQVDGTQTTVNSATMTVTDKNIEIAKGAANDAAADGAGITIDSGDGDKTLNWVATTDAWTSSEHIQVAASKRLGFSDDPNTYIDRPSADSIRFTAGGSEKVRIQTDGNTKITGALSVTGITTSARLNVTGITTVATLNVGVSGQTLVGITTILDEDNMASNSAAALATQQSIKAYVDTQVTAQDLDITDGSTNIAIDLDSETLSILGTTNEVTSAASGNQVQLGLPDDVTIANDLTVASNAGIGSLSVTGISTFTGDIDANADIELAGNLSVTGLSTFTGNIDANGNLDVDGQTDLDVLNVAETATFSSNIDANGDLDVDGYTELDDLNVAGITTSIRLNVTGITTVATLNVGVSGQTLVGINTILDEDNMASNSATALVTQQSVKAYVDTQVTAQDLDFQADTGGALSIDLDSETLGIVGTSNEIETAGSGNNVTIGLPDNVTIGNDLTVTGNAGIGSLSVTGVSTFVGVATFTTNDVYIDNKLFVGGIEISPGAAITTPNLDINDYIRHNGDLTTKFGFPADGKVVTNISGTERIRVTADGTYTTGIATATGVINSQTDVQINGTSVLTSALNEAVAMAIALG